MGDRLRCENGEWKTRGQFSKSQLDKYNQRVRAGTATANKTGMRCIEHSKQQSLEIQCQGPCNRFRELRLFSKSTRRNGKNWCVDCTDWQVKTENGETLPPPGGILSTEEFGPSVPQPANLRDDMIVISGSSNFDDDESSSLAYDDASDALSAPPGPSLYDTQRVGAGDNAIDEYAAPGANLLDRLIPPHMRPDPNARAPHWLIPELDGPLSSSLASLSVSADTTSIAPSTTTGPAPQQALRPPVPFNAWGPNGEFARMVKTPTVVSGTTSTTKVDREPKNLNLGRNGWAKVPTRKQPPQLPDYLKYETPYVDEERGGFDEDSDDGY